MIAEAALLLVLHADFRPNATLPKKNVYTSCGGHNVSPALRWTNAPASTRSFLLTVFDPDAPEGGFWHWIAYDVPVTTSSLPANAGARPSQTSGSYGSNDFGHARYDGPCPPPGRAHRYIFTLYALDVPHLPVAEGSEVAAATEGHVVAKASITGRYGR